jgi:hypothetical protein
MANSYYDNQAAKVKISIELEKNGWKIFGFREDQSDSMTDYWSPAHWNGICTKNGYVLIIDNHDTHYSGYEVKEYNYNKSSFTANDRIKKLTAMMNDAASTENEKASCATLIEKEEEKAGVKPTYTVKETYPTFNFGNPKKCTWHIEKDNQIIAKGTGVYATNDYNWEDKTKTSAEQKAEKLNAFINKIEAALKQDSALESEVIKVPKTVIKPVEIDTKVLTASQVNDDTYFIMKVGYTNGNYKGTIYKCERASTVADSDSFVFAKLGKNLKPSKARGKTWYQSITDLNNKLAKGHIAIVEMQEFIEWESKTVYKKTAKKQKANFDNAAIVGDVQEAPEVTEEITVNETQLNNEAVLNINNDKKGIEIKFNKKPSSNVIAGLKEMGFRWSSYTSVWWAKQTEERLEFATMFVETYNDIAQEEPETNEPETVLETQETTQEEKTTEVLTPYEYGVRAFNNGISCAPALDSEFLEVHIKGLKVGEGGAELMKEWLNGWTRANLDAPFDFDITDNTNNSGTTNEPDNVVYHDFGNVESQEEERNTETVNTFDDIFSKFEKVEVTTESKIAAIDLEFCQEQENIYKKLVEVYNGFMDQLQEVTELNKLHGEKFAYTNNGNTYKQDSANYYSLGYREINETINKMKNKFISAVCYYFMNKYSVTINYEKIQKKYDLNVTYVNIIDEIMIGLDGFNFTEKAANEIKEKAKEAVRNSDKITIKNSKLILDGYFAHHDSIWKEYRLGSKHESVFKALQHFEDGSISGNAELIGKYCGYDNERNQSNYERYEPMTMSKVKSIKFLKNGKLEIEFTSNQHAAKFAKEYCGYNQKSA